MGASVAQAPSTGHVLRTDQGAGTAKSAVRKADINPQWIKYGEAMREVMRFLDLSLEEFAFAMKKDSRQVARQMKGEVRPMIEAVLDVERFEGPMVIALARRTSGVDVDTVVHIRRSAK